MKSKYSNIIYILLSIWLSINILAASTISLQYPGLVTKLGGVIIALRLVFVFIAIIKLFSEKLSLKEVMLYIFFSILVVMSYIAVGTWLLFDIFFFSIFLSKILDYRKIVHLWLSTMMIGTLIISFLDRIGVLPIYLFTRADGRVRYNLGFTHPNGLGFILLNICLLYILSKKFFRLADMILLIGIGIFTYIFPNSETAAILIIIAGIISKLLESRNVSAMTKHTKKLLWITSILFVAAVIICVYLVIFKSIGEEFISNISGTLYTRFIYGRQAIVNYGFSLFGKSVVMSGDLDLIRGGNMNSYFTLDCAYVYLPITKGLIPTFFFFGYYLYCIKKAIAKNNLKLLTVMLLLIVYGVSENNLTSALNAYIFICATCYVKKQKAED